MKHGFKFGRRNFLKVIALTGVGFGVRRNVQAKSIESRNNFARYFTKEPGKLKLLAVTDLHFFDSTAPRENNQKTINGLKCLIEKFNPELMLLNGDTWYEGVGEISFRRCQWACEQIGELGIPWIFVFGNHDAVVDFKRVYKVLTLTPNSLFCGAQSYGNYRVEICSPAQEVPFWVFIIINDYYPVRGFNQYQVNWLNKHIKELKQNYSSPPPAFLFCHIPLPQFKTLWKKGKAIGIKNEPVMDEGGSSKSFLAIKDSGMVKAIFAGHDHVNNYWGEMDGVRLQYLRATGYGGYGGGKVKKGGTIINIDINQPEPKYEFLTVFEDGSFWKPEKSI